MNFSTALVTGGTGFIGQALCGDLARAGVKTTLLTQAGRRKSSGSSVIEASGFEKDAIVRAVTGRRYDVVFHLAAYGVTPGSRDPDLTFATNVAGMDAAVHAAAAVGARALVYAGSCSEYEEPPIGSLLGEEAPLTRTGLYGASKAAAGFWGQALADHLGVPFQWMRLFNVFGPGEAEHRLIPSIIRSLTLGQPVALSPGEQVRDFLFIQDVVDGLVLAAEAALAGRLGPFNLCSGQPIKVKEIAMAAAEALGTSKELLDFGALSYRPGECLWLVGRPERFESATGFRPRTSLIAGIKAMVEAAGQHTQRGA
jgi:nucleoside-diphosphate-sugar epimerase